MVLQQLSKGQLSKVTVVQGTVVQVDSCPRILLSKETIVQGRLLSKVTVVKGDFCPRRQLHVLLSKDILFDIENLQNRNRQFSRK